MRCAALRCAALRCAVCMFFFFFFFCLRAHTNAASRHQAEMRMRWWSGDSCEQFFPSSSPPHQQTTTWNWKNEEEKTSYPFRQKTTFTSYSYSSCSFLSLSLSFSSVCLCLCLLLWLGGAGHWSQQLAFIKKLVDFSKSLFSCVSFLFFLLLVRIDFRNDRLRDSNSTAAAAQSDAWPSEWLDILTTSHNNSNHLLTCLPQRINKQRLDLIPSILISIYTHFLYF